MNQYFAICLFMIIPLYGISKATEEIVAGMVPHGKISQKIGPDYFVKTKAGTKVTVEFDRAGILDEASGLNLGKGDVFEPGNGLMALETIAKSLQTKGHYVIGEWKLEKDSKLGWIYEISSLKDEENMTSLINAKDSTLITSQE